MRTSIDRRWFLVGLMVTVLGFSGLASTDVAAADKQQEYYGLRTYHIETAERQQVVSNYLKMALVPALNRMGIDRVGVFTVTEAEEEDHSIFVLIPFPTLQAFADVNPKLAADGEYQQNSAELLAFGKKDPAYTRIESRFMKAFAGMPVIEMPAQTAAKEPRMFELRLYESHNDEKARLKVDMFNSGEIDIMREVKMGPVFFGETLIGPRVPNLVYMLSASDLDSHKEHWGAFGPHPEWQRMRKLPKYKDTVSKITKWYLLPTKYSQI